MGLKIFIPLGNLIIAIDDKRVLGVYGKIIVDIRVTVEIVHVLELELLDIGVDLVGACGELAVDFAGFRVHVGCNQVLIGTIKNSGVALAMISSSRFALRYQGFINLICVSQ